MSTLRAKRHAFILEELERHRFVSIAELGGQLDVTRETIRSDIAALANRRLLRQLRGGAAAIDKIEAGMDERERTNAAGKIAIGRLVAALVPDDASLVIDSGSTTRAAARALARHAGLTIYTTDLGVARTLVDSAREVHLLGGRLGRREHSTSGPDTLAMLSGYRTDYALVGVGGLSVAHGFTDYDRTAADLRDAMLRSASTPLFLAGHEKFGRTVPARLKAAELARLVVADRPPPEGIRAHLERADIALLTPCAEHAIPYGRTALPR